MSTSIETPPQPSAPRGLAGLFARATGLVRRHAAELLRFAGVGGVAYVFDIGLFNLMFLGFDWPDWLAKIISAVVAMTVAFFGNRHWTWRERRGSAPNPLPRHRLEPCLPGRHDGELAEREHAIEADQQQDEACRQSQKRIAQTHGALPPNVLFAPCKNRAGVFQYETESPWPGPSLQPPCGRFGPSGGRVERWPIQTRTD